MQIKINLTRAHKILIAVFGTIASAGAAYSTMGSMLPALVYAEEFAEVKTQVEANTQQLAEVQEIKETVQEMQQGFDDYRLAEQKRALMDKIEGINSKISELKMELDIATESSQRQLLRNKIQYFTTAKENAQLELSQI